jgi:hypothetical protein
MYYVSAILLHLRRIARDHIIVIQYYLVQMYEVDRPELGEYIQLLHLTKDCT